MAISLGMRKGLAAKAASRARRQLRGRKKINGTKARPRLVVTRSARHLFVQVIDELTPRQRSSCPHPPAHRARDRRGSKSNS